MSTTTTGTAAARLAAPGSAPAPAHNTAPGYDTAPTHDVAMDYDDQDATAEQTAAFEAAVQAAVERALALRLPALLDDGLHHALAPLSGEVATAFADIEFSVQRLAVVEERARVAEARAVAAEQRARAAEDALDAARTRGIVLEAQVAALSAPSGLFRRRRRIPDALLA